MNSTRRINSLSQYPFRALVFLLSFIVLLLSIWPLNAPAPVLREINRDEKIPKKITIVSEIERSDSIPRDDKSWSLFLVCSQSWISNTEENLDDLFRNYMTFGKSIGPENLAIWFWRWESIPETEDLLKKVQSRLKELSFYIDDVDGLKSQSTSKAIHEYQDSVGLIQGAVQEYNQGSSQSPPDFIRDLFEQHRYDPSKIAPWDGISLVHLTMGGNQMNCVHEEVTELKIT